MRRRTTDSVYPIELLIGEATELSCELMATAIQRHRNRLSVVACATDSAQLLKRYEEKKPDVCIVSRHLRDGASFGIRVARDLRAAHQGARVMLLIDSPERDAVVEAFRSGALGVFSRDGSFSDLCKGILRVNEGQIWASSEQLRYLVESIADKASPPAITDARGSNILTKREHSLVDLVAQGLTNRDISRELKLSEHTVRNYLFRIFNKLGTSNRLELALYAISHKEVAGEQFVAQ
jgi:DNA-binding NarL/FixJ family response regulator